MIKDLIKKYWWQILFFSLAVIADAGMDYVNFQLPKDSGFWSLHTHGWRIDAWHSLKVVKWTFIAVGMVRSADWLVIAGVLNYMLHEIVYHKILKRLKNGNSND